MAIFSVATGHPDLPSTTTSTYEMASRHYRSTMASDAENHGVPLNAAEARGFPYTTVTDATGNATATENLAADYAYPAFDNCHQSADVHQNAPLTPRATQANLDAPTVKKRGYLSKGNHDAGPQFATTRRDYNGIREVDPTWPIFCCDINMLSTPDIESDPLHDFKTVANKGIPEAEYFWYRVPDMIDHVLEVEPLRPSRPFHCIPTRYFICTKYGQYKEICAGYYNDLIKYMNLVLVIYTTVSCRLHHGSQYRLSKYERVELTGNGLRDPELSSKQLSRQKRDVMVRKLSQGRKEEIAEMENKLKNATIEEVQEVASHVTFAREGEVSEVARKLSAGNAGETEGTQLQLARINMYYMVPTTP